MTAPDTNPFGGAYQPGIYRENDPLLASVEFLASEKYMVKKSGGTIDATTITADGAGNKIIKGGTPVKKSAVTGKYTPTALTAGDAANAVAMVFPGDINVKNGDNTVGLLIGGSVMTARIPGASDPAVLAALKAAPGLRNIVWQ